MLAKKKISLFSRVLVYVDPHSAIGALNQPSQRSELLLKSFQAAISKNPIAYVSNKCFRPAGRRLVWAAARTAAATAAATQRGATYSEKRK